MPATPDLVTASYDSPLGRILLAASDRGLAGLWFEGQRHWPQASAGWREHTAHTVLTETCRQLDAYFAGTRLAFNLPLDLSVGTTFQSRVWQALCAIPAGVTQSYATVAARLGAPRAARAIGAAVGRNPIRIVVPCHRVLGESSTLTGYAGGIERKAALLRLEGAWT